MANIVCFDVCGTLYRGQTTHDFCRYVRRNIRKATGNYLEFVFVLGRVLGKFRARQLAHRVCTAASIRSIQGLHRQELEHMAQAFWLDRWVNQLIASVVELLEDFCRCGDHVLLLSAAIDPPIRALAEHLDIDFICSTLQYDQEDRVTGLKQDLFGRKDKALHRYVGDRSLDGEITFYSDNMNDLLLLSRVDHGVFVSHDPSNAASVKKKFPSVDIIEI